MEIKNNPKYLSRSYDKSFDEKLTLILTKENLMANDDPEVYKENLKFHDTMSTVKSKRRMEALKAEQREKRAAKGALAQEIELEDRDLQTLKQLLNFKRGAGGGGGGMMGGSTAGGSKMSGGGSAHGNYVSLDGMEEDGGMPTSTSMRRLKRGKSKRGGEREQGLMQVLDPNATALPKALTVAIHSTVVDNVGEEMDMREV